MGRRRIEVSKVLLQKALTQAENGVALATQNELWKKAAEIYNLMVVPEPIEFSTVALRAKEFELEYLTQPGKKGRAPGSKLSEEQKQAMQAGRSGGRAAKFAANPEIVQGHKELRGEVPPRFVPLVDRLISTGSMRAAVALKCLDCCAHQPVEVKNCPCTSCPLYAFRPYKAKPGEAVDEDEVLGDVDVGEDVAEAA